MVRVFVVCFAIICCVQAVASQHEIVVQAGDNQGLIDAINTINSSNLTGIFTIEVVKGPNGETGFEFSSAFDGTTNALPVLLKRVRIVGRFGLNDGDLTFTGSGNRDFRLLTVAGSGQIFFFGTTIRNFGVNGESGGAVLIRDDAGLDSFATNWENNFSSMNGGAVACQGRSRAFTAWSSFTANRAGNVGGAITIEGQASLIAGDADSEEGGPNFFTDNNAEVFGCDINIQTNGMTDIRNSVFSGGNCQNVLIENPFGKVIMIGNSIEHPGNAIDSTDLVQLFGNLFSGPMSNSPQRAVQQPPAKTEATCNDFGTGAIISLGHNIATDDSCALDQPTDQPNTDPMFTFNEDGLPMLDVGSPAIDAGSSEVLIPGPGEPAILPCGHVDAGGLARPQDGNGDGTFECDPGAMEFPGTGQVSAGHSGAFFNSLRNGEGNYVEILNDDLAVVYTFTYRPDGSGPAWFLGVGDINDNGIVIDDLLRPIGTSFGDDFDTNEIDFTPAGSMSLVFPTCNAGGSGGSVAYTGSPVLGYEAVLSRAQRITSITGCNSTPGPNAGLSGSFFDPARNGEGVVVEWLTNGDVVVIFFTFDLAGNQFWTFGAGTPNGKSVTINALYPAGVTRWGGAFDPDEVDLQPWGTFTLTWTSCSDVDFSYASTVQGFGSDSHSYTRISSLKETSCPQF